MSYSSPIATSVIPTPDFIDEFRRIPQLPGDRAIKKHRLAAHRKSWQQGKLSDVTWCYCLCKETGKLIRVNGNTTSWLLQSTPREQWPSVPVVIYKYYICDTMRDVTDLFKSIDSSKSTRTSGEIVEAICRNVGGLSEVRPATLRLVIAAISYYECGAANNHEKEIEQRAESVLEDRNIEFAVWAESMFGQTITHKRFRRRSVFACAYGSYLIHRDSATQFWSAAVQETGPQPSCGCRKISTYLRETSPDVGQGNGSRTNKKTVEHRAMYVSCIQAWNAWCDQRPCKFRYFVEYDIPDYHTPNGLCKKPKQPAQLSSA